MKLSIIVVVKDRMKSMTSVLMKVMKVVEAVMRLILSTLMLR